MDSALSEVFDQARQLVAEADRRVAETEKRRREIEGQAKLAELVVRAEEAFDFTSREKLELDPRMDVHEDVAVIEFVVRAARAIFVLAPKDDVLWDLLVVEDGKNVSSVAEIVGGIKAEPNSRRLAAARVVASIAIWVEKNRTRRAAQSAAHVQGPLPAPQVGAGQPPTAATARNQHGNQPGIEPQVLDASAAASIHHPHHAAPAPGFDPRDRRVVDAPRHAEAARHADPRHADPRHADPRHADPRYDELPPRVPPVAPPPMPPVNRSAPPQTAAPAARSSNGTFGRFFGH